MSHSHLPPEINPDPPQDDQRHDDGGAANDPPAELPQVDAPITAPEAAAPALPVSSGRVNVAPVDHDMVLRSADEADAMRRKTLRNERLSSVMIAVLVHLLIGLGLALWALDVFETPQVQIQARVAPATESSVDRPQVREVSSKRPPAAPSSSARAITSIAPSAVYAPDIPFETETFDLGTSAEIGLGFGTIGDGGFGGGQGGLGGIPGGMKGRCTMEERMKRLDESGGNKACEDAVAKSLAWLKSVQNADGSWGKSRPAAMTGLVLLAYLGHCETPQSSKFGEVVTNGTTYLVERSRKDKGYLRSESKTDAWVYEHVIASYALGECLAFVRELKMEVPGLQDAVEQATDVVIKGQHKSGGWDYQMDVTGKRGGDTSIAGWALQALKAAKNAGYGTDYGDKEKLDTAVKKGLAYIEKMQAKDGNLRYEAKYRSGRQSLSAIAPLCFQIFGKKGRVVSRGIRASNSMPVKYNDKSVHLYAWYYVTQARFFQGGAAWEKWNNKWRDEILENQGSDGRWKVEGGPKGGKSSSKTASAGKDAQIYRNCLCTLMLEVYYRFLPGTSAE